MSKQIQANKNTGSLSREKNTKLGQDQRVTHINNTYAAPEWFDLNKYPMHNDHLMKSLIPLDEQLHVALKDRSFIENWDEFLAIRKQLKTLFIDLLKYEMKFVRQNNVEQYFWKILYYNNLEHFKRFLNDPNQPNRSFFHDSYLEIINDGTVFFQELLEILAKKYQYDLNDFTGTHSGRTLHGLKFISLAIVSSQKICIHIGDLLRYKELLNDTNNYEAATFWYVKANQLIPTNGLPINQLAILALYRKKKFEAIFYHMRSLNVPNPIKSAKESLLVLFDELRKKYEAINLEKRDDGLDINDSITDSLQREIWIHPVEGLLDYRTIFLDQETETQPQSNLYKRFLTYFLHFHGMIFTGVGTETIEYCFTETLNLLEELLFNPAQDVLTFEKIIQLTVLNILSVENCSGSSNLQEYSIAFSYSFIALLINKLGKGMSELIDVSINDSIVEIKKDTGIQYKIKSMEHYAFPDFVNNLLAACSLWCDWLQLKNKWCSTEMMTTIQPFLIKNKTLFWDKFTFLLNLMEKFRLSINDVVCEYSTAKDSASGSETFRLPEELLFLELAISLPNTSVNMKNVQHIKHFYLFFRMKKILQFGSEFLSPALIVKDQNGMYQFNIPVNSTVAGNKSDNIKADYSKIMEPINLDPDNSSNNTDFTLDESKNTVDTDDNPKCISSEIQTLLQRKNELEKSHKIKEKHTQLRKEILNDKKASKLVVVVYPKFLVTDTNCFVEFLPQLQIIASSHPMYQLIVPLVVLNELEGLTKGNTGQRAKDTSKNAQEAINFLNKITKVKYVSTLGSIIYRKAFTNHECCNNDEILNNDDKILLTAVNLTKTPLAKNELSKVRAKLISINTNNYKTIQTNLVLLTNDRNLKLKAITQNVPVREVSDFLTWSKLSVPNEKE